MEMEHITGIILQYTLGDELTSSPRTFGDIKIVVQKYKEPKGLEIPEGLLEQGEKDND